MGKTILFRVDGGNVYSVGMGHVYRCVRIARVLRQRGMDCAFIMRGYTEGMDLVRAAGFPVGSMDPETAVEDEVAKVLMLCREKPSLLFVDLRMTKSMLVQRAMEEGVKTVVYEDIATEDVGPAMLFNPSPTSREEDRYGREGTNYLLGEDYLVLDPAIRDHRRPGFSSKINKMFLCFGGADPINLSSRVLKALLERDDDIEIDLVIGPAFANRAQLDWIIAEYDGAERTNRIEGSNSLSDVSVLSDAAATSGGTIVFETITQRIPTLALPTIFSEARIVSKLMDKGLVDGIRQDVSDVNDGKLRDKIDSFLEDSRLRESIFESQMKTDLSGGLFRVADHLETLAGKNVKEG